MIADGSVWRVPVDALPEAFLGGGKWDAPAAAERMDDLDLGRVRGAVRALARARQLQELAAEGEPALRRWRRRDLAAVVDQASSWADRLAWALDHVDDHHTLASARPQGVLAAHLDPPTATRPSTRRLRVGNGGWPRDLAPQRVLDACTRAGLEPPPAPGPFAFAGLAAHAVAADRLFDAAGADAARRWLVWASRCWPPPEIRARVREMALAARDAPDHEVMRTVARLRRPLISGEDHPQRAAHEKLANQLAKDPTDVVLVPLVSAGCHDRDRVAGWSPDAVLHYLRGDAETGAFVRQRLDGLLDLWVDEPGNEGPSPRSFAEHPELPIGLPTHWDQWADYLLAGADERWLREIWPALVGHLGSHWSGGNHYIHNVFQTPLWTRDLSAADAAGVLEHWPVWRPPEGWRPARLRRYLAVLATCSRHLADRDDYIERGWEWEGLWVDMHWFRAPGVAELANGPHHGAVIEILRSSAAAPDTTAAGQRAVLEAVAELHRASVLLPHADEGPHGGAGEVRRLLRDWSKPAPLTPPAEIRRWSDALDIADTDLAAYLHYRRIATGTEGLPRRARRLLAADPERQRAHIDQVLGGRSVDEPTRRRLAAERVRLSDPVVVEARARHARAAIANQIRTATDHYRLQALPRLLAEAISRIVGPVPPHVSLDYLTQALLLATSRGIDLGLLRRFLELVIDGGDLRRWPENRQWRSQVAGRFDVDRWLEGFDVEVTLDGVSYRCRTETDPLLALRMGSWFGTCLSLGGSNDASALTNVIEANRHIVYLVEAARGVVARKLIATTDDGRLLGYYTYAHEPSDELYTTIDATIAAFTASCGLTLGTRGKPASITGAFWYDDRPSTWAGTQDAAHHRRLDLAHDPDTTPEALSRLAHDEDPYVRQKVAQNAHTSPDTLHRLAHDEDGDVRWEVAANAHTSPDTLDHLAHDKDRTVRLKVAGNAHTSPDTLERLARDEDRTVRLEAAGHARVPAAALSHLAGDDDLTIRRAIIAATGSPADLDQIADKELEALRDFEASHPEASRLVLQLLCENSPEAANLERVADHHAASPELLRQLAETALPSVRESVAARHTAPAEALTRLARTGDSKVRDRVAANRSAPPDALTRLARTGDSKVRDRVAANRSAPPEALALLARDNNRLRRQRVAAHPNTPEETLMLLSRDDAPRVALTVAENTAAPPSVLSALAKYPDDTLVEAVAENPSTPPDTLDELARHATAQVRRGVAANTSAPAATLVFLADDRDLVVRRRVAANPRTPTETVVALAADTRASVRGTVATSARTPPDVLECLAKDEDSWVREKVAHNPNTPEPALTDLTHDPATSVRRTAAGHPNCSDLTLSDLAHDT